MKYIIVIREYINIIRSKLEYLNFCFKKVLRILICFIILSFYIFVIYFKD